MFVPVIDYRLTKLTDDLHNRKVLLYISAMMAFKMASRSVNDKEALQKRLSGVPQTVIDGLLSRFTETTRNTNS